MVTDVNGSAINALIIYLNPHLFQSTKDVIREFADDNVCYLELRSTPRPCQESGMTAESYVRAVLRGYITEIVANYWR